MSLEVEAPGISAIQRVEFVTPEVAIDVDFTREFTPLDTTLEALSRSLEAGRSDGYLELMDDLRGLLDNTSVPDRLYLTTHNCLGLVQNLRALDRKWEWRQQAATSPQSHVQFLQLRFDLIHHALANRSVLGVFEKFYRHDLNRWDVEMESLVQNDFMTKLASDAVYRHEKSRNGLNAGEWLRAAIELSALREADQESLQKGARRQYIPVEYGGRTHRMRTETAYKIIYAETHGQREALTRFGIAPRKTYEAAYDHFWDTVMSSMHGRDARGPMPEYLQVKSEAEQNRRAFIAQLERKLADIMPYATYWRNTLIRMMTPRREVPNFPDYAAQITQALVRPDREGTVGRIRQNRTRLAEVQIENDGSIVRESDGLPLAKTGLLFHRTPEEHSHNVPLRHEAQYTEIEKKGSDATHIQTIREAWARGAITHITVTRTNRVLKGITFVYLDVNDQRMSVSLSAHKFAILFGLKADTVPFGVKHMIMGTSSIDATSDEEALAAGFRCLLSDGRRLASTVIYHKKGTGLIDFFKFLRGRWVRWNEMFATQS